MTSSPAHHDEDLDRSRRDATIALRDVARNEGNAMATSSDFIEYVHEQSGLGPALTYRKMFGEYALYVEGKVVALACDNSLYVKPTQATHPLSVTLATKPPFPGAKPHLVADELLDDSEALRRILLATAAALPASKIKTKTKAKAKNKDKPSRRR